MAEQKNTAAAEDSDGRLFQCSKCMAISVFESGDKCPYCGAKISKSDKI